MLLSQKLLFHRLKVNLVPLLLIVISVINVSAQDNQCKTRLSELPQSAELRGFHLGMTMEQVKAKVPQVVFPPADGLGTVKTTINPFYDPTIDKTAFADVRSISLDFFDGRLVSLWIGYDPTFKWLAVNDFVSGISTALSLPSNWSSWRSRGMQLKCADFEVTVSTIAGGPSFRIQDLSAEEALAARRVAAEEARTALEESEEEEEEIVADKKKKLYYPSGCSPPAEISESNRVTFKSTKSAEAAGFKRYEKCP